MRRRRQLLQRCMLHCVRSCRSLLSQRVRSCGRAGEWQKESGGRAAAAVSSRRRLGARELQHSPSSPARLPPAASNVPSFTDLLLTDRLLHPPLTNPPNFTPPYQPLQAHASSRASPRRSRCSGASGGGVRTRSLQRSSRASGEAQGVGRVSCVGGRGLVYACSAPLQRAAPSAWQQMLRQMLLRPLPLPHCMPMHTPTCTQAH